MDDNRGSWGSHFGFLMAAIGSAVGLGNIWGFPYKMGVNGGFAFLVVYLVLAVLIGFTVMLGELALGRKSGKGAIGTYIALSKRFKWLGWLGVLSAFLIMSFYSVLGGYCIKYMIVNLGDVLGAAFGSCGLKGEEIFKLLITNQYESVTYTLFFMIVSCAIVMGGIAGGIERFSKYAMPALFALLLVVIIRSVTLDGAMQGLSFMFTPNLEPFKKDFIGVLSSAGGQMFFSLSLGMGIMLTYGSYLSKKENLERSALLVIISDTIVAILAGVAVIPAAFALGGEGAAMAGPKLLYITLQNVFNAMGAFGPFIGLLFYLLVSIAAVTSSISLIEVLATFFMDCADSAGKKGNRKLLTVGISLAIMALATLVAADGLGSNGFWVPFLDCWLDFMDLLSEGIMMPFGALCMCLFIGYEFGIAKFDDAVSEGRNVFMTRPFFTVCCKYIAPIGMLFILWGQLKGFGVI